MRQGETMAQSVGLPRYPRRLDLHRGSDRQFLQGHPSEPGHGVSVAPLLNQEKGAEHLSIAAQRLDSPDKSRLTRRITLVFRQTGHT